MAATGGGKIRSRRYHIASKPYAKSKQQSGIISRVTDTVKSIVPSWLQKYFKNEDGPEADGAQGPDQNCQPPLPPPPPNGSEEEPPPFDGRDSPEPSTSTTGTSSSLFTQPSTSSAPGPFSTGFSLVKEIKDNLSQHEDDNISTTSGFSSRASDKDVPTSKTASLPQLWSPEMDRTNSAPQPSQSSLKRPSFNLSVFGNSSNSSLNSTVLNSSQLGDSPFYPGKTVYGGAAALRSSRGRPGTPYQAPVRRQIKAKPAGAQPCGVTSATARRILQSLERMSSPLADAKRIPAAAASNFSPSVDDTNLDISHVQSKKKRMDSTLPPIQKLVVPSASPVLGNRTVSFKPTLTPGGLSRSLGRTTREKTPARQSPQLPEPTPSPFQSTRSSGGPSYPLSSTPAASSASTGGGKMKRERTTTRPSKCPEENEVVELPALPAISLPLSTSSLPTFSFNMAPPISSPSVSSTPKTMAVTPAKENVFNKDPPKALTPPCVPFTFSSPIVKATAASPPSFSTSPEFTFSAPVAKLGPSMSNGNLTSPIAGLVKPQTSKTTEDFEGPFKPAKTLKQGSVLDLLKSPGFASPVAQTSPGSNATPQPTSPQFTAPLSTTSTSSSSRSSSMESGIMFRASAGKSCDKCSVQNKQSDAKCVCSVAPKPTSSFNSLDSKQSSINSVALESSSTNTSSATTTTTGFGTIFSKPSGTWDCDTCLVVNKPDAVKCVACETAKPGTGLKPSLTFPSPFSADKTISTPTPPVSTSFSGFGDKFKKPEGAWECDTCMVQNKAGDTKCVACMTPKPGATADTSSSSSAPMFGLGDKFKKPEGAWECDVCLVQNKASDVQCVACQTAKPGASVEPKAFGSFNSLAGGTPGLSTSTSGGFKFGTTDSTSGSGGFKSGSSAWESSSTPSGGFKFGIASGNSSSESSSKDTTASPGFKFGNSSGGFKFGAGPTDDKKSDQSAAAGSSFKFGVGGGIVFGTGSSSTEGSSSKGGFTFGLSKPTEEVTETTTSSSSTVSFTPPSQEKSDNATSSNDTTATNTNAPTTTTTTTGSVFDRLGERSLTTNTPKVSSTFGALQADKEPPAPTFTFGKPEEKKEAASSPAPSNFVFGAASKDADSAPAPAALGGFSFGKSGGPAEQAQTGFSFSKPAEKTEPSASEAPKPTFNFGQSAADSPAAPKPSYSFMANNPTTNTTTTSSSPIPSLFGAGTNGNNSSTAAPAPAAALAAAPSAFIFGQPSTATSDAAPAKTFVFGQNQDNQPSAPSSAPLNTAPAPAPAQPFIFGGPAAPVAPAAPAAAAPSFSFGAAATAAASTSATSAAPSPFAFSSAPSGGFGANQAPPSFGSPFGSPFTGTPSQTPAFGAKSNAAPVFGQQTNSTPAFGATSSAAPSGGFQFGGASAFGNVSNNNTGVFTFGGGPAASPAPPAPPANPAVTLQLGGAGAGFNFSQPPTFNIGSAKAFTSSPAGQQTIAGRKIKTAVRRRK
ncbi:nuclear pore complex protein Nup153 isoform X1 [Cololabis saira]|uniref:nuclear pore complex protein Nup153 isoform X1 n=1 Tax=Cololabis saira TaxID=129043 RepID=UPI002AD24E81|nr:nuclear pore complex protein Nup153 isoform X1 [Cololabis saira]